MKILQIIPSISLVYGGPSQMVLGLSAALATQGIEVTIVTTDSNGDIGQPPLDVPLNQMIKQDNYQIIYFRCSPFRRYKFSFNLFLWLSQHLNEFNLAHIHALFSPVTTLSATIARSRNFPYILRPCGMLDPADLQKKKQLKQIYINLLEKPNLAAASALHFTSQQEASISQKWGLSIPEFVMPLGVSLPTPSLPLSARDYWQIPAELPIILFLSRIDPKKGLNLLIPALEHLLAEGLSFHFVMAGSNPQNAEYEAQIQARIQSSSLAHYTTITGFITGALKMALLQAADLFVLPSFYENFGIAVAEAMVVGVPVIISNQVYIWEEVQQAEAGWICSLEIEDIVSQIKQALQQPQERNRRGLNAQNYAKKNYSWDAIASQIIPIYEQILSSQSS